MIQLPGRGQLLNALLVLCCCTMLLYQLQEAATGAIARGHGGGPARPAPFRSTEPDAETLDILPPDASNASSSFPSRIWITMGLCWSSNTRYHDKGGFPYRAAAPLAARLWHRFTMARVILQIVYSESSPSDDLVRYRTRLESHGVLVVLRRDRDMECVLKAQLIRLIAFKLPQVSPDDIVVTADVDAFVMTSDIARPLTALPNKKMWIYRYELTLGTGYTFMMPFIGGRARVWEEILEYRGGDDGDGLKNMVYTYAGYMNFSEGYTWDVDQHIVSHAILKSGVCSLPTGNKLWKEVNLEPKPVDDSETCWHGSGVYEDCNNKLWSRNVLIRYHGGRCKWWHFTPDERAPELTAKFEEIASGRAETGVVNGLVGAAKQFQKDWFGSTFF